MSDSMDKSMISLSTTALTKRSRKFYDGTFRWDSDGFMDDNGVYRDFDCYDPAARAPTPLPPMFPDDLEDENTDQTTTFKPRERRLRAHLNPVFIEPALPNHDKHIAVPDVAHQEATTIGMRDRQPVTAPRRFTLVAHPSSKKASSNGFKPDGKKATPPKISRQAQRAAHKISGQKASQATTQASDAKNNRSSGASKVTSRQSPREGDDDSIRDSDLSDCPSDLSDWDIGGQVNSKKAAPAPADTKRIELDEVDGDAKPTRKTTRGVAQTVRKGAKNSSRAQSNSTAPALRSSQSGSFMRASASNSAARRRSARQENAHEGK
ncbi:hypothetical protein N0V83_008356 [Neocucurbitaria cava]|uniref:Uncharacterized protein n=1 Tax=Neocucurbitaria cava TaxID=798079 RepID=A0A9W9CJG8_9PLEO|nr:hypothetical protein N0V83_008356 [Neocucurbitaria cava]